MAVCFWVELEDITVGVGIFKRAYRRELAVLNSAIRFVYIRVTAATKTKVHGGGQNGYAKQKSVRRASGACSVGASLCTASRGLLQWFMVLQQVLVSPSTPFFLPAHALHVLLPLQEAQSKSDLAFQLHGGRSGGPRLQKQDYFTLPPANTTDSKLGPVVRDHNLIFKENKQTLQTDTI